MLQLSSGLAVSALLLHLVKFRAPVDPPVVPEDPFAPSARKFPRVFVNPSPAPRLPGVSSVSFLALCFHRPPSSTFPRYPCSVSQSRSPQYPAPRPPRVLGETLLRLEKALDLCRELDIEGDKLSEASDLLFQEQRRASARRQLLEACQQKDEAALVAAIKAAETAGLEEQPEPPAEGPLAQARVVLMEVVLDAARMELKEARWPGRQHLEVPMLNVLTRRQHPCLSPLGKRLEPVNLTTLKSGHGTVAPTPCDL